MISLYHFKPITRGTGHLTGAVSSHVLSGAARLSGVAGVARLLGLAMLFVATGCVPATSYEQASSAAEVQQEGRRRAQVELDEAKRELEQVTAERDALAENLSQRETEAARTELAVETTRQERDQQTQLVTQLRGELARVGGDLQAYAGEKKDLEQELAAAEARLAEAEAKIARLQSQLAKQNDELAQLRTQAMAEGGTGKQQELDQAMSDLADLAHGQEKPSPEKGSSAGQVEDSGDADSEASN